MALEFTMALYGAPKRRHEPYQYSTSAFTMAVGVWRFEAEVRAVSMVRAVAINTSILNRSMKRKATSAFFHHGAWKRRHGYIDIQLGKRSQQKPTVKLYRSKRMPFNTQRSNAFFSLKSTMALRAAHAI